MKKISVFLVMILLLVTALVGCKTTEVNVVKQSTAVSENPYSYVDIDPLVIVQEWEQITKLPFNEIMIEHYYRNPDRTYDIQFATVVIQYNPMGMPLGIAGYSYMLDGKINVCEYNPKTNAYESTWDMVTDEGKAQWKFDYGEHFGLGGA